MTARPPRVPDTVRSLAARPARPVRRTARSVSIGAEVRGVLPEAPRRPSPADLLSLARSLVRDAARSEFVREGLSVVNLPAGFSRADLQAAELLRDRDYLGFMDRTVAVIDLPVPPPDARDARRVATAATSRDRYGLTLEAATQLAAYLADAAARLHDDPDEADPSLAAATRSAFAAEQTDAMRSAAREALASVVTAPQELRAAMELRSGSAPGAAPAAAAPDASATSTDPRRPAPAADRREGSPWVDGAEQTRPTPRTDGARGSRPAGGAGRRWRPDDLRWVMSQAATVRDFFDSDTGRAAADAARKGAQVLRDRASQRGDGNGRRG